MSFLGGFEKNGFGGFLGGFLNGFEKKDVLAVSGVVLGFGGKFGGKGNMMKDVFFDQPRRRSALPSPSKGPARSRHCSKVLCGVFPKAFRVFCAFMVACRMITGCLMVWQSFLCLLA